MTKVLIALCLAVAAVTASAQEAKVTRGPFANNAH